MSTLNHPSIPYSQARFVYIAAFSVICFIYCEADNPSNQSEWIVIVTYGLTANSLMDPYPQKMGGGVKENLLVLLPP